MATWSSPTPSSSSRRAAATAGLAGIAVAVLLVAAVPCAADTIELPPPQADQLGGGELFQALGAARDQLPGYLAPGPVRNDERVDVEVLPDGRVRRVSDEQRIRISGTGDYLVRESGPARAAVALDGEVPVLSLGDVVWQGFSPGSRLLAARLELDPELESRYLPLRIGLSFSAAGRRGVLGPDRQVPGAGTVTLTLDNTTGQPGTLPAAADAAAGQLAPALDRLRAEAEAGSTGRLPTTRTGIPAQLPVTGAGSRPAVTLVPLRLHGTLSVRDRLGTSAGQAVRIDLLLQRTASLVLPVTGPGTVALDLTAEPALDPVALTPLGGASSWAAWARTGPPPAQRRAALDLLVRVAATGARASAYSPYLGSQLEPRGRTIFGYRLAAVRTVGPPPPAGLRPRPVPIGLAVLGALALLGSGVLVWRRS